MKPAKHSLGFIALLSAGLMVLPVGAVNDEAASDQWASAFIWLQNGRKFEKNDRPSLALGAYREALRQLEIVARDYPGFEEKMVNYRIRGLRAEIDTLETELSEAQKTVANQFVTYIQSIEKADEERYAGNRDAALETMKGARSLLDQVIAIRPDHLRELLQSHSDRLDSSIAWLEKLSRNHSRTVSLAATNAASISVGYRIKGTTEFVAESDLPAEPGTIASAESLFPR